MPRLVAIDLPGGPGFVDALRRTWDAGDAAFVIDRRLPETARQQLIRAMAPSVLVDAAGTRALPGDRPVEPGDALVVATSGTSGEPKGVVLTHAAVAASAHASSRRLGRSADDTWLACLPLAHIGGLSVVTRALHSGAGVVVHDGFDAVAVDHAARAGANAVSLVATALARVDPTLFDVVLLGGSRPPTERPANAVVTYGMTETGSGVVYDGQPLDGVELDLTVDGEILVRAPMLMRCYRDGTSPVDDDGWLHTGDLGAFDVDGRLVVHGRRGDVIVTGGEKVWPDAVEAVLARHPAVADVAVAGVDDPEWGARVVAFVVPAGDPPALDELRELVAERLARYCAPKQLVLVDAIPRTTLGKVVRRSLIAVDERSAG